MFRMEVYVELSWNDLFAKKLDMMPEQLEPDE